MPETVLALSPHTDDAELGCGGTLHKMSRKGSEIVIASLCAPTPELVAEFEKAATVIGAEPMLFRYPRRVFPKMRQRILDTLLDLEAGVEPDTVFAPCARDGHQDHAVVHREAVRAFRDRTLLTYEMPRNQTRSESRVYSDLHPQDLTAKIQALDAYRSQQDKPYFDPEFTRALAHIRGMQASMKYAEAFNVHRLII